MNQQFLAHLESVMADGVSRDMAMHLVIERLVADRFSNDREGFERFKSDCLNAADRLPEVMQGVLGHDAAQMALEHVEAVLAGAGALRQRQATADN